MAMHEPVEIAILAKAPVPGFAKTRLISVLGAERAALLQAQLIERAADTAAGAKLGAVTLWGAPDQADPLFQKVCAQHGFALHRQAEGDLGARMLAAAQAAKGAVLVIGTDCPGLTPILLRSAADILRGGSDVVLLPAEDGGYVLIGVRRAHPALFELHAMGHRLRARRDTAATDAARTDVAGAGAPVGSRPPGRPRPAAWHRSLCLSQSANMAPGHALGAAR